MQDKTLTDIVHAYCSAYETENRALAEELLADDFVFTGPHDHAIDKATYFERCWPNNDAKHRQHVEALVVEGQRAFVTYSCESGNGDSYRNTEYLTFDGDRIATVEVYFGPAYRNGVLV